MYLHAFLMRSLLLVAFFCYKENCFCVLKLRHFINKKIVLLWCFDTVGWLSVWVIWQLKYRAGNPQIFLYGEFW